MWDISQRDSRAFPKHIVIMSDNTPAQAKNQYAMLYLAYLVRKYGFQSTNLFFLMVGHTHEDVGCQLGLGIKGVGANACCLVVFIYFCLSLGFSIAPRPDQLFGLVTSLILQKGSFQTPGELLHHLNGELHQRFQQKGEQLNCEFLTAVRDFSLWLNPLGRKLYGAFQNRDGVEAPHAFSFKRRRHLTPQDNAYPVQAGDPDDVFVSVKTYMRDTRLQQAPLMFLGSRLEMPAGDVPTQVVPMAAMGAPRVADLMKLAKVLREPPFELARAADELNQLVSNGQGRRYTLRRLDWMSSLRFTLPNEPTREETQPFFSHLPEQSFELRVRDVDPCAEAAKRRRARVPRAVQQ